MKRIEGKTKSIGELLNRARFAIDYYQREYRWTGENIRDLLNDLSTHYTGGNNDPGNSESAESSSCYFLGSIVVSEKNGRKFLVDGQQRLTTLTLLLIYAYHQIDDGNLKRRLIDLIRYSEDGQTAIFNLYVEGRFEYMTQLFERGSADLSLLGSAKDTESVKNIAAVYGYLEKESPRHVNILAPHELPAFINWLLERVFVVEIITPSDSDAYIVFETMNDRGLPLRPEEMLKSFLLSKVQDARKRQVAAEAWEEQIGKLRQLGLDIFDNSQSAADEIVGEAIQAWLRARYAVTDSGGKDRVNPKNDFESIGANFYHWARDRLEDGSAATQNLISDSIDDDYYRFIREDFRFYTNEYLLLRAKAKKYTAGDGFEGIYYNAINNFTLQLPALLAPINKDDLESEKLKKIILVANYFDIVIARHIWNSKRTGQTAMRDRVYRLIEKIRGSSLSELSEILITTLNSESEDVTFEPEERLHRHGTNRNQIHFLLARMTDFIERESKAQGPGFVKYGGPGNKFEIEHIWVWKFRSPQRNEFNKNVHEYRSYRNRIGGLLLLDKSTNASIGDQTYKQKIKTYLKQNLLARSLCPDMCSSGGDGEVGFRRFRKEFKRRTDLEFRPCKVFNKEQLDERQEIYRKLAGWIWSEDNLKPENIKLG